MVEIDRLMTNWVAHWLEGTRYLNMQHLAEHKKEATGRLGNIDLYGLILGKQSRQKAIRKWG